MKNVNNNGKQQQCNSCKECDNCKPENKQENKQECTKGCCPCCTK